MLKSTEHVTGGGDGVGDGGERLEERGDDELHPGVARDEAERAQGVSLFSLTPPKAKGEDYDDDLKLVDDRRRISYDYITGWFLIDLVCIIPFDLFL